MALSEGEIRMSAIRPITAVLAFCLATPVLAEPSKTPTTVFDAYIDQTFGDTFERTGPTQLIPADPANKLSKGEPSALLETEVKYRQRARLTADLPLPSNFGPVWS